MTNNVFIEVGSSQVFIKTKSGNNIKQLVNSPIIGINFDQISTNCLYFLQSSLHVGLTKQLLHGCFMTSIFP